MFQQSKTTSGSSSNPITEGVIWQQLLLFFFPILFGTFFQQLYNTADAVIVGRFLGKQALAAVGGSTTSIINLLIGFFHRPFLWCHGHYLPVLRVPKRPIW